MDERKGNRLDNPELTARLRALAEAIAASPTWFDDRALVVAALEVSAALSGACSLGLARGARTARRATGTVARG